MKRPWHELDSRAFWDPNANNGEGAEYSQVMSLKDRLGNPSGMHYEALATDIAKGLSQVMDAIDQHDTQAGKKLDEILTLLRPNEKSVSKN